MSTNVVLRGGFSPGTTELVPMSGMRYTFARRNSTGRIEIPRFFVNESPDELSGTRGRIGLVHSLKQQLPSLEPAVKLVRDVHGADASVAITVRAGDLGIEDGPPKGTVVMVEATSDPDIGPGEVGVTDPWGRWVCDLQGCNDRSEGTIPGQMCYYDAGVDAVMASLSATVLSWLKNPRSHPIDDDATRSLRIHVANSSHQ